MFQKTLNIRISIILIITLSILYFSCNPVDNSRNHYEINGIISGISDCEVVLGKLENGKIRHLDSVMIHKNHFTFKGGRIESPEIYYLIFDNGLGILEFFLENSLIEIKGSIDNLAQFDISGSQTQAEYQSFLENNSVYDDKQNNIFKQVSAAKELGDSLLLQHLDSTYQSIFNEQIDFIIKYVIQNNKSVVSTFITARTLMPLLNTADLEKIMSNFTSELSNSVYIAELIEEISNRKASEIGKEAPEIALQDSSGIIISLHNQRGKYVLLNFGASWNPASRTVNKELLKLSKKYSSKDFIIFSVSLDENRENWKNSIENDGLNAVHVCSLKGVLASEPKLYAIITIPSLVLIDPDGIIILRDFTPNDLEKILDKKIK